MYHDRTVLPSPAAMRKCSRRRKVRAMPAEADRVLQKAAESRNVEAMMAVSPAADVARVEP